ncbi:hypothetical protein LAUMK4_00349 [Mycobacterium persicum]|uniref:Uncharacterized protein n=1 Tax=Mycobacterium persicum TaxID=1487726 RepID=A0ABY6RC53_9MYCO|nr:hypothetical protein LAUMK15_00702 [Mycobacterium persicum]VAZ87345.1 hypothetical protein LAUMK4_00349 [Mycobacterium persicum]
MRDYRLIRSSRANGVCRATIGHPPINLLDMPLLTEIDRLLGKSPATTGCGC